MNIVRILSFFTVLLIIACGTPKKSVRTNKTLAAPVKAAPISPPKDTIAQNVAKDTEANSVVKKDTVAPTPQTDFLGHNNSGNAQKPTPEQLLEEQKATGINRNYSYTPAIHFDMRKPQYVMIHHTSQSSLAQTIRTFQLEHTQVSSHYVIGRDGQVVQMLNDYVRSWHAGAGKWGNITDMNSVSIGIELDNSGREPFPQEQINALLTLLDTLKTKYRIPQANFIGHRDFAPGRKDDPSNFFPWKTLAQRGFGIWYNEAVLQSVPPNFNPLDGLKIIGYDTSNQKSAIIAFKKKFVQFDTSPDLTEFDIKVIYDLYRRYY